MYVTMRDKGQFTLPKAVVKKFGFEVGQEFEVSIRGGAIHLMPVAVYPPKVIEQLAKASANIDRLRAAGELKKYSSVKELIADIMAEEMEPMENAV